MCFLHLAIVVLQDDCVSTLQYSRRSSRQCRCVLSQTIACSAGLDYSGVGPEHALLQATGRVKYISARDYEALEALHELCAAEGILTALETAHAYAAAREYAKQNPGKRILIGNSGRGDKDMPTPTKIPPRIRS